MIRKAVIPAAGFGTRVLPMTKAVPKEMLPIVDKPSIQYIVEECVKSGITDILVITTRGKEAIENHFDKSPELEKALRKPFSSRSGEYPSLPMSSSSGRRRLRVSAMPYSVQRNLPGTNHSWSSILMTSSSATYLSHSS